MTYVFIVLAWVYGFLMNFPAVYTTTDFGDGQCISFSIWPNDAAGAAFGWGSVMAFYFVPLLIFVYGYGHILVTIKKSGLLFKDSEGGSVNTTRISKQHKNEYALIKTMLLITIVFILFWAPLNTVFILAETNCCGVDTSGNAWQVGVIFGTATLFLDPFIYAMRFSDVKKYFKKQFDAELSGIQTISNQVTN